MTEGPLKVFIATGERDHCERLRLALNELNHHVVKTTDSGHELMQWLEDGEPEFVFVGPSLTDIDSMELVNNLSESQCCPAIVMVGRDGLDRAKRIMVDRMIGIIVMPITAVQLRPSMYVARRRFEQMMKMRDRIKDLRRQIYSPSSDISEPANQQSNE